MKLGELKGILDDDDAVIVVPEKEYAGYFTLTDLVFEIYENREVAKIYKDYDNDIVIELEATTITLNEFIQNKLSVPTLVFIPEKVESEVLFMPTVDILNEYGDRTVEDIAICASHSKENSFYVKVILKRLVSKL